MLKDINGKTGLTFWDGDVINDIEEIKERLNYRYNLNEMNIIGFAKFNPFLDGDNRFCNHLDRNSWYPITSVSYDLYIQLVGVNKTHLGLFSSVVAIDDFKHLFKDIKETKPRVIKYWAKKTREKNAMIADRIKRDIDRETLEAELNKLTTSLGNKASRKGTLTSYLKNNFTEERLFEKMEDPKWKAEIIADIDYRLKTIDVSESLKYGSELHYLFPSINNKYKKSLTILKHKIDNPISSNNSQKIKVGFFSGIKNKIMALID